MYERYASFNRYGDLSKFITDPDLLQVTGDECIYISNANDYDIAVDLETCYASFDEVKPFITFLATQIYELDNAAQRFHRKKRVKNSQLRLFLNIKRINFSCGRTARLTIFPTTGRMNSLSWDMEDRNDIQQKENVIRKRYD